MSISTGWKNTVLRLSLIAVASAPSIAEAQPRPSPAATVAASPGPGQTTAQTGSSLIIDQNRADRRPTAAQPTAPAPAQRSGAAVAGQAITPFVLRGVQISGAHAPAALIGPVSRPYIGRTVDAGVLAEIADAVAKAYEHSDIALYTVILPTQDFANGILRLRVVEGFVQTVTVTTGAKQTGRATPAEIALARRYAEPLLAEHPLRKQTLQRAILLTRDMAGITADVQILQGRGMGAVQLVMKLRKKLIQAGVGINNRGTAELGRTQVEVDLTLNGLFRAGDQTRLTVAAPTDVERFQYYALSHTQLLNADGLSLTGSLGYLRTRPLSVPIKGRAETAGLSLSYPLIRGNEDNLFLTGSLDGVDSTNAFLGQTISNEQTRSLRFAAAFSRAKGKSALSTSGTLSFGIDGLGAKSPDRRLSVTDYTKLNGRFGYDRQLAPKWTVRLRALAQYSPDRLPASEQVTLGGDEFGRAFLAGAFVGDDAVAGSSELAYAPAHLPTFAKGSELYGYVDAGKVWYRDRTIVPKQDLSLSSIGGGARLAVFNKSVIQFEAAQVIHSDLPTYRDDTRFIVSVRSTY